MNGLAPVLVNPSLVKNAANSIAELNRPMDQRRNAVVALALD
jgi:hypothetical protein